MANQYMILTARINHHGNEFNPLDSGKVLEAIVKALGELGIQVDETDLMPNVDKEDFEIANNLQHWGYDTPVLNCPNCAEEITKLNISEGGENE